MRRLVIRSRDGCTQVTATVTCLTDPKLVKTLTLTQQSCNEAVTIRVSVQYVPKTTTS